MNWRGLGTDVAKPTTRMADHDQEQKTEQATEKKVSEAFERGQFAKSHELTVLFPIAAVLGVLAWKRPHLATSLPAPIALTLAVIAAFLARGAPDEQRVVVGMSLLALLEVGIIAALATLFASFSSPFLSAVFTFALFLVGRSADTLAKLPVYTFGPSIKRLGVWLSWVVPNLQVYVPPRPLLTGESSVTTLSHHLALAALQTVGWATFLLIVSSIIFKRRDFL